jgi:hypothetical protein
MTLRWLLIVCCLSFAAAAIADGEAPLYRLSYRKHDGMPWVFYADISDKAKAEHIAGTLHTIGYQSQIRSVSAAAPKPPVAASQDPPPLQPAPENLAPEPSLFGQGSPSHFPTSNAGPYHIRTPYHAPFNTPFGLWGFGWGYSLGLNPQINHTYNQNYSSYRLNAPVHNDLSGGGYGHPTPYPGHR